MHSLAVTPSGEVWAWGSNSFGQVGDGTLSNRVLPLKISESEMAWMAGTPVFSVVSGTYTAVQTVTVTSATPGVLIHYTTTGSEPTQADTSVSSGGTVSVGQSLTLKAKAFKDGAPPSHTAAAVYVLRVATPVVSPGGSTFSIPQAITVSCSTLGATLRYTTNGLEPTEADPSVVTGGTVSIDSTRTLKVKAWLAGWTNSNTATATYTMVVATPTLSPSGGSYGAPQIVTATTSTPGASIHYTTDGSEPTSVDPTVGAGGVTVDRSLTLKTKALRLDWTASATTVAHYVLGLGSVVPPVFTPAAGTFAGPVEASITTTTPGAVVRYTTDGSDPTFNSTPFSSPVAVGATATLKARAYKTDYGPSAIGTATYTVNNGAVAAPQITVASGSYATARSVTISCATSGATIRYSTTGVDPTASDPSIASGGTLLIDRSQILKARAFADGSPASATTRRDFVITGAISAGYIHSLALDAAGVVWSWGGNTSGQLGDGTTQVRHTPAPLGLTNVIAISAGYAHSLALTDAGQVWSWGGNSYGQLGDGTTTGRTAPAAVGGISNVIAIFAAHDHSLAVKADGTVWVWGRNANGQLGDGTTTLRSLPVQVPGITSGRAVAGGLGHSVALMADGSLRAWGLNSSGELGDGTNIQRLSPVAVSDLTAVVAISSGNQSSYALRNDGAGGAALWSWGGSANGELGDGTTSNRNRPLPVLGGVAVAGAGFSHAMAILTTGSLTGWGRNNVAQVGDSTMTNRWSPIALTAMDDGLVPTGGEGHSLLVRADGTVVGWGRNSSGQLGGGTTISPQTSPVQALQLSLVMNAWLTADSDGDGLRNLLEYLLQSDPLRADTNGDGVSDGAEHALGRSPSNPDLDGDGLLNADEIRLGTNVYTWDTDGDGSGDGDDDFPLDPTRWQSQSDPSDTTPPTITLIEPTGAVLQP